MSAPATGLATRRPVGGGGFTLFELLSVMAIIAVLAAAAVPALSAMNDTRGAMAGKQLLHDLTYARQHAIATGTVAWVVFDPAAETWELLAEDPASPGRLNATAMTNPATGQAYRQTLGTAEFAGAEIVGVAIDGDVEVGFDWLGAPRNAAETALAADGTVTITGNHVVRIHDVTGHSVYEAP